MAILFRRANGIYYCITYHNGHRVWRSTGMRRRLDAEMHLQGLTREIDRQKEEKPVTEVTEPGSLTFREFMSQWRTYAETSFAPSTIRLCNEAIRNFLRIVGDRVLTDYRAIDIEHFKACRIKEVSPSKTNIDFADIKAIFNVAAKWDLLGKNACVGAKLVKIPPQRPAYLTKEEFSRLLDSIKIPWLKDIVTFAVSTMMRASEIANA
jgi:integrase